MTTLPDYSPVPPLSDQWHPTWCQETDECYRRGYDKFDVGPRAWHQRTYATDNGIDLFRVDQFARGVPPQIDAVEVLAEWSSLDIEDLPAAAQVLLQVYRDLANVHPHEFLPFSTKEGRE